MNSVVLRCPNCGGKIVLNESKDKGYCENCGSEIVYQKEIDKLHEEKKIEIENALNRVNDLLSERKYISAEKIIEEYLVQYPFAGELYLAKLMCVLNVKTIDGLASVGKDYSNHPLYIRALKYLPSDKKSNLISLSNRNLNIETTPLTSQDGTTSTSSNVELTRMQKIDKEVMDTCMTEFLISHHKDVYDIIKQDGNLYQKLVWLNTLRNSQNSSQVIDFVNLILNRMINIRFIENDDKALITFLLDDMATRFRVMEKYFSLSEDEDFKLNPQFKVNLKLALSRLSLLSDIYEEEEPNLEENNEELDEEIKSLQYELDGQGLFNHSKKAALLKEINNKKKEQINGKLALANKKMDYIKKANEEMLSSLNKELSSCPMTAFSRKKELKEKIMVLNSSIETDYNYLGITQLQDELKKYK